jgi:hypothetical protein
LPGGTQESTKTFHYNSWSPGWELNTADKAEVLETWQWQYSAEPTTALLKHKCILPTAVA